MAQVVDEQNDNELQTRFTESVKQCKDKINSLKQELETCKETHSVVESLPRKIEHEIMVPLGDIAYMPGKLIHTNELLVLLGDNYFAKRSAYQTEGILTRRENLMKERIHNLNMELDQIYSKMGLVSDFENDDELMKPPSQTNEVGQILKHPQSNSYSLQQKSKDKSKEKRVTFIDETDQNSHKGTPVNQSLSGETLDSRLEELEKLEAEAESRGESVYAEEEQNEGSSLSTAEVLQQSLGSLAKNIEQGYGDGSEKHVNIMEPLSEEDEVGTKIEEIDEEKESSVNSTPVSSDKSPKTDNTKKYPITKPSVSEGAQKAFSGVIQERPSKKSHQTQPPTQKKMSKFKQMRQRK